MWWLLGNDMVNITQKYRKCWVIAQQRAVFYAVGVGITQRGHHTRFYFDRVREDVIQILWPQGFNYTNEETLLEVIQKCLAIALQPVFSMQSVLRLHNETTRQDFIMSWVREDVIQVLWPQGFNCTKENTLKVILKCWVIARQRAVFFTVRVEVTQRGITQDFILCWVRKNVMQVLWPQELNCSKENSLVVILKFWTIARQRAVFYAVGIEVTQRGHHTIFYFTWIRDDTVLYTYWPQGFNCTKGNSLVVILKELGFKTNWLTKLNCHA
jgi:hypothetical protein